MGGFDLDARKKLVEALIAQHRGYTALEVFLDGLGRSLGDYSPIDTMPVVVGLVVKAAEREKWVGDLIHEAAAVYGKNPSLRMLTSVVPRESRPVLDAVDLSMFDMHDIEQEFNTAVVMADKAVVVGTAVVSGDDRFLDLLCLRLTRVLGTSHSCQKSTLDASLNTPARLIAKAKVLANMRHTQPVLFLVRAEAVKERALVAELWDGLGKIEECTHPLTVVLSTDGATTLPAEITMLPEPSIKLSQVVEWVDLVADGMQWERQSSRRRKLAQQIWKVVDENDEALRYFVLYNELEQCLKALQNDPEAIETALDAA